jgi:hypothetical protein
MYSFQKFLATNLFLKGVTPPVQYLTFVKGGVKFMYAINLTTRSNNQEPMSKNATK